MVKLKNFTPLILFVILLTPLNAQVIGDTVRVRFSEWMDTTGFSNPNNFEWTDGLVTLDVRLFDTSLAIIRVSEPRINHWYTLEVFNVYDIAGNLINPDKDTTGRIWRILPVELESFTAKVIDEKVYLKWITKTEVDNYGFDIERKTFDDDWKFIGFKEGHGNSNSQKEYNFIDKKPVGGTKFKYRLKQIDTDGKYEYSDEIEVEIVPDKFILSQNYPNPFNSSTVISYSLPVTSNVEFYVFNVIGEIVHKEFRIDQAPGYYELKFNEINLSSGTYFYRLQAGTFVETKKMVVMK